MARMIFDLTEEDREALERVRISLGYRSHAETLRRLIRRASENPEDMPVSLSDPLTSDVRVRLASAYTAKPPGSMRLPKAAPGSRLKKR